MATTTPNYGWDVPTSTDYVKDGATAIETLGDDIDASLFSITSGKNVGLVHINTTTFSASSGVNIDNVFTSDFDTYVLYLDATATGIVDAQYRFRNGSGNITATNYIRQQLQGASTTVSGARVSGFGYGVLGNLGGNITGVIATIWKPNKNDLKAVLATCVNDVGAGIKTTIEATGYTVATVATGINIFPGAATMTGTVRIYGMRNA